MLELPVTTTHASRVLFHDKPSHVINLPDLLGGILALIVLEIAYIFASQRWRLPSAIAPLPVVLIGLRVGIAYSRTFARPSPRSLSTPSVLPGVAAS